MSECQCPGPGYCARRNAMVSTTGYRLCKNGRPEQVAAYFDKAPKVPPTLPVASKAGTCAYLGPAIMGEDGRQETRLCASCRGAVRLKLWECGHPGHSADPTTTEKDCGRCSDWVARPVQIEPKEGAEMSSLPVKMVVPRDKRPGVFPASKAAGGVLQIMVTRACDMACHGCTAGSNLVHKPAVMTPEQFDEACASLEGYPYVVGVFGGNPTTSRYFEDYCRIMRARFPLEQRGLWCNRLFGKGAHAQITFDPKVSNANVHLSQEAYDEFARDWPEAIEARRHHVDQGLHVDSRHGSPWVGMADLETLPFPDGTSRENTEANRWNLIKDCTINKNWSAMICLVRGELRGFACEIMGHMAALHQDNPDWAGTGQPMPDVGLKIEPGWWRKPLAAFDQQFRTCCHNCAVPLNRPGQLAIGGEREEFSATHAFIAKPKVRDREVAFIGAETLERRTRPSTEYLSGVTPGYRG